MRAGGTQPEARKKKVIFVKILKIKHSVCSLLCVSVALLEYAY